MDNRQLGAWGEKKAANYLRLRGYKIIDMNCRYRQGEIDAAQLWLQQNETELQPRFDVIEIYAPNGEKGRIRINHIENAF